MIIPETKVLNKYSQSQCRHLLSSIYRIVFAHTGTRTIRTDWIKIVGSLTGRIVTYKDPLCPNSAAVTRRWTRPSSETSSAGVWCVGLRFSVTPRILTSKAPMVNRDASEDNRFPVIGHDISPHFRVPGCQFSHWSMEFVGGPLANRKIHVSGVRFIWLVNQSPTHVDLVRHGNTTKGCNTIEIVLPIYSNWSAIGKC